MIFFIQTIHVNCSKRESRSSIEFSLQKLWSTQEKAGYAGDVYLLFQRLDADNSGKLTLDEIDEDTAKLWLAFKLLGFLKNCWWFRNPVIISWGW